jgi:hypothetical protein
MHMSYEEFRDLISFEIGPAVWLECKLTKGTFGTIEHLTNRLLTWLLRNEWGILQREPSPRTSQTKDEQFLDSEGPPPLEVPRNVIDMMEGMADPTFTSTNMLFKPPPSSPSLHMPNVFVVPPEEDHSPSWCYFQAPPLMSTPPDTDFLHNALNALHHSPAFHRSTSKPIKSGENKSITEILTNSERDYIDDELDFKLESVPHAVDGARGTAEDSVVVEVVKLRRHEQEHVAIPPAKHSKSLKSRASKAFRSLKNVGKGSMRSRLNSPGASTPTPGADDPSPRERTPTVSRRSSIILSQMFTSSPTLKSHTSVSSFENQRPRHDSLASTLDQRIPAFVSSTPYNNISTSPNSHIPGFLDSLSLSSASSCQDSVHQISPSPSPTSIQTFSNKRRFSMMSLQQLFSFSSSDHGSEPSGSGSTTPTSTSMSRNSSGPSAASSLGPDTPTEGLPPLSLQLPLHLHPEGDDKHFLVPSDHPSAAAPALGSEDLSFEMRLDSLHFETLSFDASRF